MSNFEKVREYLKTEAGKKTNTKRLARKFGITYEEAAKYRAMISRKTKPLEIKTTHVTASVEYARTSKGNDSSKIKITEYKSYTPFEGDKNNVLVISDTHLPFEHPDALRFCREIQEKYNCGTVVHIGDIIDNYAISRYDKDPSSMAISAEYEEVLKKLKAWYETFPEVKVCIGNHDARIFRKVALAGLPEGWLKSLKDILGSPERWKYEFTHEHNGVIYTHGTNFSGDMAAVNIAKENRQSTVIGHLHTVAGVRYVANRNSNIFGMSVGCLVDDRTYAFAYGKENARKSIISCGVVLNGKIAIVETM